MEVNGGWGGLESAKKGGAAGGIPTAESHCESRMNLADSPHAFKWLGGGFAHQLVKEGLQLGVVKHILTEYVVETRRSNEGRENDVGKEAFGTLAAPRVGFAARVTAAEDGEVFFVLAENHGYLQLGQGSKKAVIVSSYGQIA